MKPGWRSSALSLFAVVGLLGLSGCSDEPDLPAAVYRVEVDQCQGADLQIATAVAVGSDVLATVAHSLAGAETVTLKTASGQEMTARLIYFDPLKDIALLRLDQPSHEVLTLAAPVEQSQVTVVTAAVEDGPALKPATILSLVDATLDGEGERAAIRLAADISPGDSGAPVVDDDGAMVGMVFATARGDSVGWAVSSSEIIDAIERESAGRPGDLTPAC